jgi:hypothetical protein
MKNERPKSTPEMLFVEKEIPSWKIARILGWSRPTTGRALAAAGYGHHLPGRSGVFVTELGAREFLGPLFHRLRELERIGGFKMPGRRENALKRWAGVSSDACRDEQNTSNQNDTECELETQEQETHDQ